MRSALALLSLPFVLMPAALPAAQPTLDQRPAVPLEWGYRPAEGSQPSTNPPSFTWRPQKDLVHWEVECGRGDSFDEVAYRADGIKLSVHTPPQVLAPGEYVWRYRGQTEDGRTTDWSEVRRFTIPEEAVAMPLPAREELAARVPSSHPRLFVRPEDLPRLREMAEGPLREEYEELVRASDRLLADPPPTAEPPTYPEGTVVLSDAWREIWWGNRVYTSRALDGAATLAFTWRLSGNEEYGQLARRILLDCAEWDPVGATGYLYNTEAGMPYNYFFSRTYSFVYDLLTEEERELCREVMRIRGEELYHHLHDIHLWQPYGSHRNRAWHFLGEMGVAFLGEIPEAEDWLWLAMNIFYAVYPVWSDDDGGWHEGATYWSSYLLRFTWWADVMRAAVGVDAFDKPFFSQTGYYAMYLMPPGARGGGLGDGAPRRRADQNLPIMTQLAAHAQNGHWQWYVEAAGGPRPADGYVGFIRGMLPDVEPVPPDDLPTSRHFRGTGQAYLNTSLVDAAENVQVVFKSSPFGTQSHGYEANNTFILSAYNARLLVNSGHYDTYGSPHHRNWVWSTRSVNNITVDGHGQGRRSEEARGRIEAFHTGEHVDIVVGEAAEAYQNDEGQPILDRFTRSIVFVKPDLIVVYDRLVAKNAAEYQYWLHSPETFQVEDQRDIRLRVDEVGCTIAMLVPEGLTFTQTDQYDPNPHERIQDREWHLTATTPERTERVEFVTVIRPYRLEDAVPPAAELTELDGGYAVTAATAAGRAVILLPAADEVDLAAEGLIARGALAVEVRGAEQEKLETVTIPLP